MFQHTVLAGSRGQKAGLPRTGSSSPQTGTEHWSSCFLVGKGVDWAFVTGRQKYHPAPDAHGAYPTPPVTAAADNFDKTSSQSRAEQ